MKLLAHDTIAFVAYSDPPTNQMEIEALCEWFQSYQINVRLSPYLYDDSLTNLGEKVSVLHDYFEDPSIRAIFDVSGGNRSNSILSLLDYERLSQTAKPFFGYSDLTTILNAFYSNASLKTELFQIRTLVWDQTGGQKKKFAETFFDETRSLYQTTWHFIQGSSMSGEVIGGNLRCFLKLAGTPYLPDFSGKLLFLESRSGGENLLFSLLHQLKQLPKFNQLNGVLLGTFTEYEETESKPVGQFVSEVLDLPVLPMAQTVSIGHGKTSQAMTIGQYLVVND